LDQKEYEALIATIEQTIETTVRGYRPGNHFHILDIRLEETAQKHDRLYNGSDGNSGDQYLDAKARGYREGCDGSKLEGTSRSSDRSSHRALFGVNGKPSPLGIEEGKIGNHN